jgi:fermentation-respiration switch protein FrsA (DUF1100 family)
MIRAWGAALAGACLLAGCSPQSLFYYPNNKLYLEPAALKIEYEQLSFPSLNGKKIWAILMKTAQKPRGTVVHLHGNFGNLSNHFPLSAFLLQYGFDVLVVDYQGYGASEGSPSPRNTVEDGIAAVRFAQAHLRTPGSGVVLFGQSLGGAVGVDVAAREPLVRAAVIEAGFSSYSRMGAEALQRHFWSWPFSFIAYTIGRSFDPIKQVAEISPRPLFFIHGDRDAVVPVHMSRDLYEKAKEPKRLWIVPGADHLGCRQVAGGTYERDVVAFFQDALAKNNAAR